MNIFIINKEKKIRKRKEQKKEYYEKVKQKRKEDYENKKIEKLRQFVENIC